MSGRIVIRGGGKFCGELAISGSKNAALPIIIASILVDEDVTLYNVPRIDDVMCIVNIMRKLGSKIDFDQNTMHINNSSIFQYKICNHANEIRASFLILVPILYRFGLVSIPLPGGCKLGNRPVDFHINALSRMGINIKYENCAVIARISSKINGVEINFPSISVGATEHLLIAAVVAEGVTCIHNAAIEPEVTDLANFLISMGANISGIGTSNLMIVGTNCLKGCQYSIMPDRIEAGGYAIAATMTRGDVVMHNINDAYIRSVLDILKNSGVTITVNKDSIRISNHHDIAPIDLKTMPYPDFPTDLQPQIMSMLCISSGISTITETIFENRFMSSQYLVKMGAKILITDRVATIYGSNNLRGMLVKGLDLRGSMALVLAGMVATGSTVIRDSHHIKRGYENLDYKLKSCGIDVNMT